MAMKKTTISGCRKMKDYRELVLRSGGAGDERHHTEVGAATTEIVRIDAILGRTRFGNAVELRREKKQGPRQRSRRFGGTHQHRDAQSGEFSRLTRLQHRLPARRQSPLQSSKGFHLLASRILSRQQFPAL